MLRGATHAFFRTLLRTHDVTGAVAAAKEAAAREATQGGFNAQEIVCLMADQVFDHVMEASRRSLPTGDALARKVDEPAARARAEKAFLFETLGEAEFCRLVERVFTDPSELHRSLRRNFLMVDLFPELTSRFGGEEALPESTPAAR
jgi:hypothetical protein